MAQALTALQRVAAGQEATPGTAVNPARIVPHLTGSSYTEAETRQRLDEARGVLAYVDDIVSRRMTTLELQQELDVDMCLLAFLCGMESVNGQPDGTTTTPYTYTFEAGIATPKAKAAATFEVIQSDGAADHVARRFSNARPSTIGIEFQDGNTTRLATTWMGGAGVDATRQALNAELLASRRVITTALWTVDVDDTWAALGTTRATNVRGISWQFTTGLQPSYHLRGRENYDLDGWYDGRVELALGLTLDLDAAAAAEVTHWRAGDLRFVRLATTRGSAGAERGITIDQAVRIIDSPNLLNSDGEQATVEFAAQLRADPADIDNAFLRVEVLSGLSAWG